MAIGIIVFDFELFIGKLREIMQVNEGLPKP